MDTVSFIQEKNGEILFTAVETAPTKSTKPACAGWFSGKCACHFTAARPEFSEGFSEALSLSRMFLVHEVPVLSLVLNAVKEQRRMDFVLFVAANSFARAQYS